MKRDKEEKGGKKKKKGKEASPREEDSSGQEARASSLAVIWRQSLVDLAFLFDVRLDIAMDGTSRSISHTVSPILLDLESAFLAPRPRFPPDHIFKTGAL